MVPLANTIGPVPGTVSALKTRDEFSKVCELANNVRKTCPSSPPTPIWEEVGMWPLS